MHPQKKWTLISAVLIIATSVVFVSISTPKKPTQTQARSSARQVITQRAVYGTHPIAIQNTGQLIAKDQLKLIAQSTGELTAHPHPFQDGQAVKKGAVILQINPQEHILALQALKSKFQTKVISVLADIQLDYPDRLDVWAQFFNDIQLDAPLPPLPTITHPKEHLFLSSRDLINDYLTIKQRESALDRLIIKAPFNGSLVDTQVKSGDTVTAGTYLGRFITDTTYTLWIGLRIEEASLITIGQPVTLTHHLLTGKWTGKIMAISKSVDPKTQLINVGIHTQNPSLKEGMYMITTIHAGPIKDCIQINRDTLINDQAEVFIVTQNTLVKTPVKVRFKTATHAYIQGLAPDTHILTQAISGAHTGMKVIPIQ
jgi:membrane fusion protein (multidrug efflux system)